MKKHTLSYLLMASCLFSFSCKNGEKSQPKQENKKPNIVYILTDQWRGDALGYAGDPNVKTPHLDAFAKTAVNFTNAISVTPVCTPHRAALLTGKFPTTTGMFLNDLHLPEEELTMAEIFKNQGYTTAFWGKWHLDGHGRSNYIPEERRQGFDYWKGLECSHQYNKMPYYENNDTIMKYWPEYSPFAITKDAGNYIAEHANDSEPFLLLLSIATPHYPHESAPQQYKDLYPKEELILPPNISEEMEEKAREEMVGYYAHATATDAAIGSLLTRIEELNQSENTIIVFSADHGEMMGAHGVKPFVKQLAWDESLRVPFLIHFPGMSPKKNKIVNAPINTPDILPSILGLTGTKIPAGIEGEDLSELMKNPDQETDRATLFMNVAPFGPNFKDPGYRGLKTKQYTYLRTIDGGVNLYDNIADPYQMKNLAENPEYSDLEQELETKLKAALEKIDDSFEDRDYYLKKWNYSIDNERNHIDWWSFSKGEGKVQSPKPILYP